MTCCLCVLTNVSVLSAQTTTESPASRPCAPEIPKSPPKWPLRPGVLVHVKCDTKQTLCANRAQSPLNTSMNTTSNLNNVSYASPLLNTNSRNTSIASGKGVNAATNLSSTPITLPDLPARNAKATNSSTNSESKMMANKRSAKPVARTLLIDEDGITANVEPDETISKDDANRTTNDSNLTVGADTTTTGLLQNATTTNNEPNNDELLRFTSSNLIERILGRLRWRREQSNVQNGNAINGSGGGGGGSSGNEDGILAKSNKRAVSLLRATGWFGSGKSTNSTTGLMTETKNHLNGITCGDSGKYFRLFFSLSSFTHIRNLVMSLFLYHVKNLSFSRNKCTSKNDLQICIPTKFAFGIKIVSKNKTIR